MALTEVEILSSATSTSVGGVKPDNISVEVAGDGTLSTIPFVFNLKEYGATGDGVTDDGPALVAAIAALNANGGGTLYVPAGTYRVLNTNTTRRLTTNASIVGDGPNVSVFNYIDYNSPGTRRDFLTCSLADLDITLKNFGIIGDWGDGGNYDQQSHLIGLNTFGNLVLDSLHLSKSRYFAAAIGNAASGTPCNSVIATNCRIEQCLGDGISTRNAKVLIASNNYFFGVNDDAIAYHVIDAETSPINYSATISGNVLVQSQGITCLGAKHTTISGNSITRASYRAITVQGPGTSGFPEGNTPLFSINISDNIVDTVFSGATFSPLSAAGVNYITVTAGELSVNSGGFYPNNPDGSGGIVSPYPYFYLNGSPTPTAPNTGAYSMVISGNVCMRSLEPTANYSDYGFGDWIGRSGPANPTIDDVALGLNSNEGAHYLIVNSLNNVLVSNNTSYGAYTGVYLSTGNSLASLTNVKILGNIFSNYRGAGVLVTGGGDVEVSGNTFDADPLHNSVYRGTNGTWQAAGANIVGAIWQNSTNGGIVFSNNQIKNVYQIYIGGGTNNVFSTGNRIFANPVGGYNNATNEGIRNINIPLAGTSNQLVVYDSDPTSATYGFIQNICLQASATQPNSGLYLSGIFVSNTSPTVSGTAGSRYIVQGWTRLTNGSSHVANTDWVENRTLTGT